MNGTAPARSPGPAPGPRDWESLRQHAVRTYGLEGVRAGDPMPAELLRIATIGRTLTGAASCEINVVDRARQVTLAAAGGARIRECDRTRSVCSVLTAAVDLDALVAADARSHPLLRDHPRVAETGADPIGFYVGLPLTSRDGRRLGAMCVVGPDAVAPDVAESARKTLEPLRDAVMDVLDRSVGERAGARAPAVPVTLPNRTDRHRARRRAELIHDIIDARHLEVAFQPIVHLADESVVGFEALVRGPAGTSLESPLSLIQAARAVGRLAELDWLCRATALKRIRSAGLPGELAWFVNVEPVGLRSPCPADLRPLFEAASHSCRLVFEVIEREIEHYLPDLMRAAELARTNAWAVAADDVGSDPCSLATLPLLQPDVVKLDLSALAAMPRNRRSDVVSAVRGYAERTGAAILAEGVETDEHRRLAGVFGATYGQGWAFGRPGPLPQSMTAPVEPLALRQRPESIALSTSTTVFDAAAAGLTVQRCQWRDLAEIQAHLLRHCALGGEPAVLAAVLPDEAHYVHRRRVYDSVASRSSFSVVLVRGGSVRDASGRHQVLPLPTAAAATDQLAVAVVAPHFVGALVVRAEPQRLRPDQQVEFVYTQDRAAAVRTVRAIVGLTDATARPSAVG